jgi:GNAT superfamily N-acetyltransferase
MGVAGPNCAGEIGQEKQVCSLPRRQRHQSAHTCRRGVGLRALRPVAQRVLLMSLTPTIDVLRGAQIQPWIGALARLRIAVFCEWPYLYAGDADDEAEYLKCYAHASDAVLVVARIGAEVIGCSTALPLRDETPNLQAPFVNAGIEVDSVCYFGESVLLPQWRGRGLGHRFFDARETHARTLAGVSHTAFCAVLRDADDPRRPLATRTLESFWRTRGYLRQPQLVAQMDWREIDTDHRSVHTMTFWTHAL